MRSGEEKKMSLYFHCEFWRDKRDFGSTDSVSQTCNKNLDKLATTESQSCLTTDTETWTVITPGRGSVCTHLSRLILRSQWTPGSQEASASPHRKIQAHLETWGERGLFYASRVLWKIGWWKGSCLVNDCLHPRSPIKASFREGRQASPHSPEYSWLWKQLTVRRSCDPCESVWTSK